MYLEKNSVNGDAMIGNIVKYLKITNRLWNFGMVGVWWGKGKVKPKPGDQVGETFKSMHIIIMRGRQRVSNDWIPVVITLP